MEIASPDLNSLSLPDLPDMLISAKTLLTPQIKDNIPGNLYANGIQAAAAFEIPETKMPEVAIPQAPIDFPQDKARATEISQSHSNQHISFHIEQIILRDVQNGEDFIESMKNVFQTEIAQYDGAGA